jgi:hypothetical protein
MIFHIFSYNLFDLKKDENPFVLRRPTTASRYINAICLFVILTWEITKLDTFSTLLIVNYPTFCINYKSAHFSFHACPIFGFVFKSAHFTLFFILLCFLVLLVGFLFFLSLFCFLFSFPFFIFIFFFIFHFYSFFFLFFFLLIFFLFLVV